MAEQVPGDRHPSEQFVRDPRPAFPHGQGQIEVPEKTPRQFPPLPSWLSRRLLRPAETVEWVRGPKFNPSWERYATHPALFLVALCFGILCLAIGAVAAGSLSEISAVPVVLAAVVILGSVFVLAIANGFFTRLVVTNFRLLILQGYEVCRHWNIDDLPRSLLRYHPRTDIDAEREEVKVVNVEALQTLLSGSSDQFADPKTILALSRQLDRIKARERDRP